MRTPEFLNPFLPQPTTPCTEMLHFNEHILPPQLHLPSSFLGGLRTIDSFLATVPAPLASSLRFIFPTKAIPQQHKSHMPDYFMQKPHPATRLSSPFYLLSVLDTRGHWERRKGTDQGVSVLRSLLLIYRHLNLAGLLSCDPGDFKTECCQKKTMN